MWVVGAKVVCSLVSLPVTPGFWVVFTVPNTHTYVWLRPNVFLGLVRHGCGGLGGWQVVLLCSSMSSDWFSGGVWSVALRLF